MEIIKEVNAQMLIRKSATEVYQAFVNPEITTQFWFTHSTGSLAVGEEVTWTWQMYGVSAVSVAIEMKPNEFIKMKWIGNGEETIVEYSFEAISPSSTYLSIKHHGFQESGSDLQSALLDSTGGFTMVLAGCKAWLEHGIHLNLIGDKYPKEVAEHFAK